MEDYDRYMDERGHEACAQMLARNSARDRAASAESITAKLREQADRIDLWAAHQSEHGFSPISIDMRSEVDRIDGYIRELKDEINWLNAELHGVEIANKKLEAENGRLSKMLDGMADTLSHAGKWGYV